MHTIIYNYIINIYVHFFIYRSISAISGDPIPTRSLNACIARSSWLTAKQGQQRWQQQSCIPFGMAIPGFVRASLFSKDWLTLQLRKIAKGPQQ